MKKDKTVYCGIYAPSTSVWYSRVISTAEFPKVRVIWCGHPRIASAVIRCIRFFARWFP